MQATQEKYFPPSPADIKKHLEFLFSEMKEYEDGRVEISILTQSETFGFHEFDKAVSCAVNWNNQEKSVYTTGAVLDPGVPPFGRASEADFYATSLVWCDIDEPHDKEKLQALYAQCRPNAAVITAKHPYRRIQLWWKLDQNVTDLDLLREMLQGVQIALGGDPKVVKPASLMRLGGTINYPPENKRLKGRITEPTEFHKLHEAKVSPEAFMAAFPAKDYYSDFQPREKVTPTQDSGLDLRYVDGREQYMSNMIYAAILNLAGELERWPTPQEVYDDAWPVYWMKVKSRDGKTLDQEGRGQKSMQQKILSKLRLVKMGRIRNCPSLEALIAKARAKKTDGQNTHNTHNTHNAHNNSENRERPKMSYTKAKNLDISLDSNDFVQGMLGNNQLSVIYGESNCGKTFFATDLAFHVALGKPWRERRVDQGGIIYAALEGSYGLRNRVAAFRKHFGSDPDMPFAMVASQIDFLDPEGNIKEFVDLINRAADDLGSVKMVVVDTLARALMGGDENSSKDMGMIVRHADAVRYATGAHASFIHHAGKDRARGARGHSSLRAACDTEIEIFREQDSGFATVKTVKQREMEMGKDFAFRLEPVQLGVNKHNEAITSCVVMPYDSSPADAPRVKAKGKSRAAYDVLLNALTTKGYKIYIDGIPHGQTVVVEDVFKAMLAQTGHLSGTDNVMKMQFFRIRKDLIDNNLARVYDRKMWIL